MAKIVFNIERCKGCGLCVAACRRNSIVMSEGINRSGHKYAQIIDPDNCTACGMCFQMCPDLVIEIDVAATRKPSGAAARDGKR